MLKNDSYILKNDDGIFKSQVVDSYIRINTAGNIYFYSTLSGLTEGTSVSMYYQTPTATIKKTCSTNGYASFTFVGTSETSYKNIYFCGNLDAVMCMQPNQQYTDGKYTGDFVCFINQFPNLTKICMNSREMDFNQDISYSQIPRNVDFFGLFDCGILGNITTIKNINNVKCWDLNNTRNLTGNFHDIDFNGQLLCTNITYASNLSVNLNCLVNDNPNYVYSRQYVNPNTTLCADTIDVSNLEYLYWYIPYSTVKGDFTDWCFNTGLTTFFLYSCIAGNVENWDISETKISTFSLCGWGLSNVSGDTSGWVFPDETTSINFSCLSNICCVPSDYSNTSLSSLYLYYLPALSGDVTTYVFPTGCTTSLSVFRTSLSGNLENASNILSGRTYVSLTCSNFTGNLDSISIYTGATSVYLCNNCLSGNVSDFSFTNCLLYLSVGGNPDVYLDLNTSFDTKNMNSLYLCSISGITGSFNNMTIGSNLQRLCFSYSPIYSDVTELNLNNISYLALSCTSLSQDITSMFTGSTNLCCLNIDYNPNLSGDTTNWEVDNMCTLILRNTSLCGRLKHACPYCIAIENTDISSCIDVDWDLSQRGYYVYTYNSCLQGDLSNVVFNYACIYQFAVYSNPNLYGATAFANMIFDERKTFTRGYVSLQFQSIGDYVTGTSETLGSLGSYSCCEWCLTETEVNCLAAGKDYDGLGSNQCWDPRQKMYWVKCALVGVGSTTRKYPNLYIAYSCG